MKPDSPRLDRFADLLADEHSPKEAARIMGYPNPLTAGNNLLQILRKKLGPQAR